jgi:hypothetical protein
MNLFYKNLFLLSGFILVYACHGKESKIELKKNALTGDDSLYLKIDEFLAHNDKTPLEYDRFYFPNFKSNYKPTGEKTNIDTMLRFHYKMHFFGKGNKFYNLFESIDSLGMPIFFDEYRYLNKSEFSKQKFKNIKVPDLLIFVDTTQYLRKDKDYYPKIKTGDEYPVYLTNNSNLYYYSFMELTSFTIIMQGYRE